MMCLTEMKQSINDRFNLLNLLEIKQLLKCIMSWHHGIADKTLACSC